MDSLVMNLCGLMRKMVWEMFVVLTIGGLEIFSIALWIWKGSTLAVFGKRDNALLFKGSSKVLSVRCGLRILVEFIYADCIPVIQRMCWVWLGQQLWHQCLVDPRDCRVKLPSHIRRSASGPAAAGYFTQGCNNWGGYLRKVKVGQVVLEMVSALLCPSYYCDSRNNFFFFLPSLFVGAASPSNGSSARLNANRLSKLSVWGF